MTFLLWVQAAQAIPVDQFTVAVFAFAGLCAVGGLTLAVKIFRIVLSMKVALYGDELFKEPSGLMHETTRNMAALTSNNDTLAALRRDFGTHVIDEAKWMQDLSADVRSTMSVVDDMGPRMKAVERHVALQLSLVNDVKRKPKP